MLFFLGGGGSPLTGLAQRWLRIRLLLNVSGAVCRFLVRCHMRKSKGSLFPFESIYAYILLELLHT